MNSFRPEPHVAQQSRRDKLRVQQNPLPATHHQFRDVRIYDPPPAPMFSSAGGVLDFTAAGGEGSFMNSSTSGIHDSAGWIMNCVGGAQIQTPNLFPSHLYHLKNPNLSGYHDVSGELSTQKQYGDLHFPSTQLYNTALHDVVTSAVGNQTLDAGPPGSWVDTGNELLLLPSYGNSWYGDDGDLARIKPEGGFASATIPTGGSLSLSLSSNTQVAQFDQEQLVGLQNSRATFSSPYPKLSVSSGQGIVGTNPQDPRRGAGPLGPFTGYAAILKSSKFLKPAQQLLDEFCSVATGSRLAKHCDASARSSGTGVGDSVSIGRGGNSGVSSSSFYSSTEAGGGDGGGASSGGCQVHRPEFQQKKAKLLYMQEEVCRRYKQYHQQMQMVVSSFESVAGLSAATPYTSLALKAIAKHFRCLKNLITDQLQHVSKLLGEEFMSSPSSSKGDTTPRLKCMGQSTRKQKAAENSLNFLDHSQPVWRPQRGLPERAVAVLRAWLFDHFLHPYPTDTDKHMLATQTGLSRNQVSNWFINARVRLWKPMVEEIHMLETKGMTGMDLNSSNRNDGKPAGNEEGQPSSDQMSEAQSNKPMDCSPLEPMLDEESSRAMEQWHREKRTRMEECGIPTGMGSSLMNFAAYQGGMDIGGLGAVSLTLGLQHNEGSQQQQQQMRRHFGSHMIHDFVG